MTEDQQPVWVESDGVNNLPTVAGVYRMQVPPQKHWIRSRFCFFDGLHFHSYGGTPEEAMKEAGTTTGFEDGEMNAWWDYQGLMSHPADGCKVFHASGGVHISWRIIDCERPWSPTDSAIMASDEPGIAAMQAKPAPEPEKVVIGGLTIDMVDLVEFLKSKQPKPEPNTTPRGILTVWNESGDHRLGMRQQTGNFAD